MLLVHRPPHKGVSLSTMFVRMPLSETLHNKTTHCPRRLSLAVTLGMMLKLHLDTRQQEKYKEFDELRYIMSGAVFFTSLVVVLLPAEVEMLSTCI